MARDENLTHVDELINEKLEEFDSGVEKEMIRTEGGRIYLKEPE